MVAPYNIGVLALQGNFAHHTHVLKQLGVHVVEVRKEGDLRSLDALVIPGGESTTLSKLLVRYGLFDAIRARVTPGANNTHVLPVLGTCAGMILCARTVMDGTPDQLSLECFDASVRRNAIGPQRFSHETEVSVRGIDGALRVAFIRAPVVQSVGRDVEVLSEQNGLPIVCRQEKSIYATFHPEITDEKRLHALFLEGLTVAHIMKKDEK